MRLRLCDRRLRVCPSFAVERVALSGGIAEVSGWTRVPDLTIVSDLARIKPRLGALRTDTPGGEAHAFVAHLPGFRHLSVTGGDGDIVSLRLDTVGRRLHAGVSLAWVLVRLALFHARDIVAYLAHGDSAAGDRVEQLLLRPRRETPVQTAPQGLVAETQADWPEPPPVDIILPVHNAYDDLERCLDHLGRYTDGRHRLHLIDDASTDPRIAPLLEAFARARPDAVVTTFLQNRGFIAAVNHGLARSRGHVVLLNTDAFVPPDWLARLIAPLADPSVASVTPLSNAAEIASVPLMGDNPMPDANTAARIDEVARRLSPDALQDAPVGVGFCMAMSRAWLDRVGALDPVFGRGYGEEVDWCRRVSALGGRHIITGNLFVPHRGGGSFGHEKAARIAANNAIVRARHPDFEPAVEAFKATDPLLAVRFAAALVEMSAPLAIYLGHRQGGGAEHWLAGELAARAAAGLPSLVLRDGDAPGMVLAELMLSRGELRLNLPLGEIGDYLGLVRARHVIYSCLVGARDPLGLLRQVRDCLTPGDRFEVMVHDYFPICPSYNLLGTGGNYCDLPGPAACQTCYARLPNLTGQRPETIAEWRADWGALLGEADQIRCFSAAARDIITRVWPDLGARISLQPHQVFWAPQPIEAPVGGPVIGVLGSVGLSKGAAVLQGLARSGVRIVVIGALDPAYSDRRLTVHGAYERGAIGDVARSYGIDRWFIPSIWPETFSYTTHECLATGLPVFAFDLGGQGEAVRAAPNGIALPRGLAGRALADALSCAGGADPVQPEFQPVPWWRRSRQARQAPPQQPAR